MQSTPTKTVECFYSLSSPWAYLGGPRFEDIAQRHRARIVLRPFDWFEVVPQNGGIPLRTRPQARQDYHATELDRWRRYLNLPLNLKPRFYPTNNIPAGHMVIAAQQAGLDGQKLSHAILKALWADERDISDRATRKAIADEIGMDGAALVAAEASADVVAEFHANSERALANGVFGSPTYLYDGEKFWGQDRLDFLDRAMAGGG